MSGQISLTREQYLDAVAQQRAAATDLAERLNMTQLTWQPAAGERWSILECLDHIAASNEIYLNAMETAAHEASRGREADILRPAGALTAKFLQSVEPPPKNRFRAPRKIQPRPTLNPEGILPNYLKSMDRLSQVVRSSEGKDLNAIRFRNPIVPLFRFSVATGLLIAAAHGRRHLWQAEQVTKEPDFPR